jgi:hypothetical protein
MRHILLSDAVPAASFGVLEPPSAAGLVALACLADRVRSGRLRAVRRAINLAAVAVAADEHLRSAAHADKQSARGLHWRQNSRQRAFDRGL